ncbi:MAG: hypothetical protein ACYDHG_16370, partial [Desulfomonilaceae bacterium]
VTLRSMKPDQGQTETEATDRAVAVEEEAVVVVVAAGASNIPAMTLDFPKMRVKPPARKRLRKAHINSF